MLLRAAADTLAVEARETAERGGEGREREREREREEVIRPQRQSHGLLRTIPTHTTRETTAG
jgi:hypothetical protein